MERRTALQLGAGATAMLGVGAIGGAVVQQLRLTSYVDGSSGHAVGPQRRPNLSSNITVWRARTNQLMAALTFDDGPDPRYTPGVLKALADADVTATFFMLGRGVEKYPELARQVGERHDVGNHTYNHPDLSRASAPATRRQLHRTHISIEKITGKTPVLFRPPYGRFSGAVEMVVAEMDYDLILWSDRFHTEDPVPSNERRLGDTVKAGSIVLFHDGGTLPNRTVVESLPEIIARLKQRGIRLVGMLELLATMRKEGAEAPSPGSGQVPTHIA